MVNAMFVVALLSSFGVYHVASKGGISAEEDDDDDNSEEMSKPYKRFRSLKSNVYVVPNFLPHDLAVKWRDTMTRMWNNTLRASSKAPVCDEHDTWLFATNNNGTDDMRINNAKVRSPDNIDARNATAQRLKASKLFSYAKWELHPSHSLVKEIEDAFTTEIWKTVKNIIKVDDPNIELAPQLADLFVTHYSTGDFLSQHDDAVSGTWAFVVSFMDGPPGRDWDPAEFGGGLRFECPSEELIQFRNRDVEWCQVIYPSFNSAVLIQTRVPTGAGPMHEVLPVSWKAQAEGFHRFGLTGWYMNVADEMSDSFKLEREKMRARDYSQSKANKK